MRINSRFVNYLSFLNLAFKANAATYFWQKKPELRTRIAQGGWDHLLGTPDIDESDYERQARQLCANANRYSPYWKQKFRELNINPNTITLESFLNDIPVTTRDVSESAGETLFNNGAPNFSRVISYTSGSTNYKMMICHHQREQVLEKRNMKLFTEAGVTPNDRILLVADRRSNISLWSRKQALFGHELIFREGDELRQDLSILDNVEVIIGYSCTLSNILVSVFGQNPKKCDNIKYIQLMGEPLSDASRAYYGIFAENAIIDDIYANSEYGLVSKKKAEGEHEFFNGIFPVIQPLNEQECIELGVVGMENNPKFGKLILIDFANTNPGTFYLKYDSGDLFEETDEGYRFLCRHKYGEVGKHFDLYALEDACRDLYGCKLIRLRIEQDSDDLFGKVFVPIVHSNSETDICTQDAADNLLERVAETEMGVRYYGSSSSGEQWRFGVPELINEIPTDYVEKVKVEHFALDGVKN